MEKQIILVLAATFLLSLIMTVETSSSNDLFSSLQFTRNSLMGFSRGSERTVEILTPKLTITESGLRSFGESYFCAPGTSTIDELPWPNCGEVSKITYQKKQKTYRPRTSSSNKFLAALDDIERAVANARASGVRYSEATLSKLKGLLVRAIRGKSYTYAREVLGQIMFLLSNKPSPPGRKKRAVESEGTNFVDSLRQQLGNSSFDSFLAVHGDVSLMFVIDDTGSMREEIQATKFIATDIINHPRQAPVTKYILSPFNDPYPANSAIIVLDEGKAGEFVKAINRLSVHDGGDCPEYTFKGMLEALYQDPQKGSPMYVFTDAGPKDATDENIEELNYFAAIYDTTINFFITGFCKAQGGATNDPRHPAFKQLAEQTSGQAIPLKYQDDKRELDFLNVYGLMGGMLDGTNIVSIGSNKSKRKKRSARDRGDSRYNIPVDESINKMTVTVTTTRLDTYGEGITLTDSDDNKIYSTLSLSQISVYQVNHPKKGSWTLLVSGSNGEHEFYVKSSSETNVDFKQYFEIPLPGRGGQTAEVPISRPVIGKLNKMVITVAGSEKLNTRSLRLELISTDGTRISDVTLQARDKVHFTASITPRSGQSFKLKLKGTTIGGNSFERISHKTIKPTTTVLRGEYASNYYTLPLGRVTFVHFKLCNFGATEYFDVTVIKDKMGYIITPRVRPKRIIKGHCATISIRAKATRSLDVDKTDSPFIIAKGRTSKVVVSQAVDLLVV